MTSGKRYIKPEVKVILLDKSITLMMKSHPKPPKPRPRGPRSKGIDEPDYDEPTFKGPFDDRPFR